MNTFRITPHRWSARVGAKLQRFDPWGAPETPLETVSDDPAKSIRAGYTGHEMDVETGLINMKGRLYDPRIARFMQADPIMQAPFWSQGLNRYSYVFNNPLQWTDPSGFVVTDDETNTDFETGDCGEGCSFGTGGDDVLRGEAPGSEDTIFGQSEDETPSGSGDATGESAQAGDDPEADLEPAPGDEGFGDIFAGDEPVAERGLGSVNPASAGGNVGPASSLFQFIHSMSEFFEMVDRVETAASFTPAGDMMTLADPDAPLDDKFIAGGGIVLMGLSELRAAGKAMRMLPGLKVGARQFGKKVGQHARDFGLDPSDPAAREWVRNRIDQIVGSYDQVRQGAWRGGAKDYLFYGQGADVVVTKSDGEFVTILSNGISSPWFQGASAL